MIDEESYLFTSDGYKQTKDISRGDLVLTHKNRFQMVDEIFFSIEPTFVIKGQGFPSFTATADQLLITREKILKRLKHTPVCRLKPKVDFATRLINQREANPLNITADEAFVLGRYTADGYVTFSGSHEKNNYYEFIRISIGDYRIDKFHSSIKHSIQHKKDTTTTIVSFFSKRLTDIAKTHCGRYSLHKGLTPTVLDLPKDILRSFVDGYLSGDGCMFKGWYEYATVSDKLNLSLSSAILKAYGVNVNMTHRIPDLLHTIESRVVHQNPIFHCKFKEHPAKTTCLYTQTKLFSPIKTITEDKPKKVLWLKTKDNSLVVNNVLCHGN